MMISFVPSLLKSPTAGRAMGGSFSSASPSRLPSSENKHEPTTGRRRRKRCICTRYDDHRTTAHAQDEPFLVAVVGVWGEGLEGRGDRQPQREGLWPCDPVLPIPQTAQWSGLDGRPFGFGINHPVEMAMLAERRNSAVADHEHLWGEGLRVVGRDGMGEEKERPCPSQERGPSMWPAGKQRWDWQTGPEV